MKRYKRRYQLQIKKAKRILWVILFIVFLFAIYQLQTRLDLFNKPVEETKQEQPLPILVFLSYIQPTLLPDSSPLNQLDNFTSSISAQTYSLSSNGELIPDEGTSNVKLLFSEKPTPDKLAQIFWTIAEINKTTSLLKGYVLDGNFFYTGSNLPDIVIPLNLSTEKLSKALQSIPSLVKIKSGIKKIDLRFHHPIIQ